jgi:diguanylate cyclase (GGDEF)-like protein
MTFPAPPEPCLLPAAAPPTANPPVQVRDATSPLAAALLDSRARWRDLALLAADLMFETDAAGRFAFLGPDRPLGHAAEALLGTPATALLATQAADPCDPALPPRGLRAWLRTADGSLRCLEFAALPVAGGGLRGIGQDVTAEEAQLATTARSLRSATALVRLLGTAQRSRAAGGEATSALEALLGGILLVLGCSAAAVLEATANGWRIAAAVGAPGPLPDLAGAWGTAPRSAGPLALVPVAPSLALAAWRDPPPDAEVLGVLAALVPSVAALQAESVRQRELDRAARTDPLTGLLNRRGFAEALAVGRRGRPDGVLAYFDTDGLKALNDLHGHATGDDALRALAVRMAAILRPGELAARLGGDEFVLWLPGVDLPEAGARCGPVGAPGPLPGQPDLGPLVRASVGLAPASADDDMTSLMEQADAAMYGRKRAREA